LGNITRGFRNDDEVLLFCHLEASEKTNQCDPDLDPKTKTGKYTNRRQEGLPSTEQQSKVWQEIWQTL
jgi:hypothetical protein